MDTFTRARPAEGKKSAATGRGGLVPAGLVGAGISYRTTTTSSSPTSARRARSRICSTTRRSRSTSSTPSCATRRSPNPFIQTLPTTADHGTEMSLEHSAGGSECLVKPLLPSRVIGFLGCQVNSAVIRYPHSRN